MTDHLETVLRAAFEADSADAPILGAHAVDGFARTARAEVRARRRRSALVAGSVVLACAVVVPLAALRWDGRDGATAPATPPVAPPTSSQGLQESPAPTGPSEPVADGVLHVRGVTVRVPRVMLEPGNRRCGTSLVDAAWWEDEHTATEACLIEVPTSFLNEVTLRVAAPGEPVDAAPRRTVMEDGRTAISVGFPDRGVVLRVLSPLARRAEDAVATARQIPGEGQLDGCRIKDPGDLSVDRAEGSRADIAPDPAAGGVVCGYREGWLVGTHVLGHSGATALARKLNAIERPVSEALRDCKTYDGSLEQNGAWSLQFVPEGETSVAIRATPFRCSIAPVVNDQGVERQLPPAVAQYLAGLAVGPVDWWVGGE